MEKLVAGLDSYVLFFIFCKIKFKLILFLFHGYLFDLINFHLIGEQKKWKSLDCNFLSWRAEMPDFENWN